MWTRTHLENETLFEHTYNHIGGSDVSILSTVGKIHSYMKPFQHTVVAFMDIVISQLLRCNISKCKSCGRQSLIWRQMSVFSNTVMYTSSANNWVIAGIVTAQDIGLSHYIYYLSSHLSLNTSLPLPPLPLSFIIENLTAFAAIQLRPLFS